MASRAMVPTDQRRRLRLVAPNLSRFMFPRREGRRSNSTDDELDVSNLRRRDVTRHVVLHRKRKGVV